MEVFGKNSFSFLVDLINRNEYNNILLVTGRSSFDKSQKCLDFLSALKDKYVVRFLDFSSNPKIEDVSKGIQVLSSFKADVIIGIGGGSPIDVAKLLSIYHDVENPNELSNFITTNSLKSEITIPLILVPTTAGSGSEATHFSVVYVGGKKYSVANKLLLPKHVFLDPEFLHTVSKKLAAVTALDAFAQAIESYWSAGSTKISQAYSLLAIELLLGNYEALLSGIDNEKVNERVQKAANYAGKAINISKTTAAHAMSYGITTKYGIPHGHAVALTLGAFIEYNCTCLQDQYYDSSLFHFYKNDIETLLTALKINRPNEGISLIEGMLHMAGLATKLSEIGLKDQIEIEELADGVNIERLSNNPRIVNRSDILQIIRDIA